MQQRKAKRERERELFPFQQLPFVCFCMRVHTYTHTHAYTRIQKQFRSLLSSSYSSRFRSTIMAPSIISPPPPFFLLFHISSLLISLLVLLLPPPSRSFERERERERDSTVARRLPSLPFAFFLLQTRFSRRIAVLLLPSISFFVVAVVVCQHRLLLCFKEEADHNFILFLFFLLLYR